MWIVEAWQKMDSFFYLCKFAHSFPTGNKWETSLYSKIYFSGPTRWKEYKSYCAPETLNAQLDSCDRQGKHYFERQISWLTVKRPLALFILHASSILHLSVELKCASLYILWFKSLIYNFKLYFKFFQTDSFN